MVEEDHAGHLNAAGEVQAVIEACQWMAKQKSPEFSIHFDYNGLEKWAKNEWKANSDLTRGSNTLNAVSIHQIISGNGE